MDLIVLLVVLVLGILCLEFRTSQAGGVVFSIFLVGLSLIVFTDGLTLNYQTLVTAIGTGPTSLNILLFAGMLGGGLINLFVSLLGDNGGTIIK